MTDLRPFIVPKSDQMNADDLIGGPRTVRITEVSVGGGAEQPVSVFFENDGGKPFKPCKSMMRVMVNAWGPDSSAYSGKWMTLYRDAKVKWGGLEVGGIRISHMSGLDREMVMALTETRGKRQPYVVKPLADAPKAADTPKQADTNRAKAEAWFDDFKSKMVDAIDDEQARAIYARAANALSKLEKEHPDLYTQAASLVPAASAPGTDTDEFGYAVHPAEVLADKLLGEAKACQTIDDLAALTERYGADVAAMPEEIAAAVESGLARERERLGKAPAGAAA